MRIYSRTIIGLSLFLSIVFLVRLLIVFPSVLTTTDTPGIYLLMSISCLIFFCVAFFFLFNYIKNKNSEKLTKIELIAGTIQFISIILLLLSTTSGLAELIRVSYYCGYILLLLGSIAYYRTKNYISISYISWGVFILLWINNFYNGIYILVG